MNARQIIGDGFDQANNTKDRTDQVTILKTAFQLATKIVPDHTKRNQRYYMLNTDDYQQVMMSHRLKNLNKLHPSGKQDTLYQRRLRELVNFHHYAMNHGAAYFDDLVLFDKTYHIVYPSPQELAIYIKPYRDYLQQLYTKKRKPLSLDDVIKDGKKNPDSLA